MSRGLHLPALFWFVGCATIFGGGGCSTTVDSLGYNDVGHAGRAATPLRPLTPITCPNALRDVLGKSDAEISAKLAGTFNQLFHGNSDQTIYYAADTAGQAYIKDILHGDVRTEGIGWGMIIAVELNKRTEFDALWAYAKNKLEYTTGDAKAGYFLSSCDTSSTTTEPCIDTFGHEQFVMALIFAHDRWGSTGAIDYSTDAQNLLHVMRFKEDDNGGVVGGVTNSFDATTLLAFDVPVSAATNTRTAVEMPAYYELWGAATGDSFWTQAAAAGRSFWKAAANTTTGMMPLRANLADAKPVSGSDTFVPDVYRALLNLVLDRIWIGSDPWDVDEANRLLQFFNGQGMDSYGSSFSLDGTSVTNTWHDPSLVAVNGAIASIATMDQRQAFIDATWNLQLATGTPRYYSGILTLLSLLTLSGQYCIR
jgi:oligosaccharide reducing-end xylanase